MITRSQIIVPTAQQTANILGQNQSVGMQGLYGPAQSIGNTRRRIVQASYILYKVDTAAFALSSTIDFTIGTRMAPKWLDKFEELDLICTFTTAPSGGTPTNFVVILQTMSNQQQNETATDYIGVMPDARTTTTDRITSTVTSGTIAVQGIPGTATLPAGAVTLSAPPSAVGAFLRIPYKQFGGKVRVGVGCTTPWTAGVLQVMGLTKG